MHDYSPQCSRFEVSNFSLYRIPVINDHAQGTKDCEWPRSVMGIGMNHFAAGCHLHSWVHVPFRYLDFLPQRSNGDSESCVEALESASDFLNLESGTVIL